MLFSASVFIGVFSFLSAQPDPRFAPMDWVQYRQTGDITSITEGFTYVYFGSESGGILRYHGFGRRFEEPITRAQGISSNTVTAVHFDRETGILWAGTDQSLEYSFNHEGDWHRISLIDIGLDRYTRIDQIGSSKESLWIRSGSLFIKLDRSSGILLGMFSAPDVEDVQWSSGRLSAMDIPTDILESYSVMDGWLYIYDGFLGPKGKRAFIRTAHTGKFRDIWIGCSDGMIFLGDTQMKALTPVQSGLANSDVMTLFIKNGIWIGGRWNKDAKGITHFFPKRQEFYPVEFDVTLNMNPQPVYEILEMKNEVWFGGMDGVMIYNKQKDYWRFYGSERGFPMGRVRGMVEMDEFVWVAASRGLTRISKKTKRLTQTEIGDRLKDVFIYDLIEADGDLWIATEYQLMIYSTEDNTLKNFRNVGHVSEIAERMDGLFQFTALAYFGNTLAAATSFGIIGFDFETQKWSVLAEPSKYAGSIPKSLAGTKQHLFIGTDTGLFRVDTKDDFFRIYNYPFIGQVNDMYINKNQLWLGTSEGLVMFRWKKDL